MLCISSFVAFVCLFLLLFFDFWWLPRGCLFFSETTIVGLNEKQFDLWANWAVLRNLLVGEGTSISEAGRFVQWMVTGLGASEGTTKRRLHGFLRTLLLLANSSFFFGGCSFCSSSCRCCSCSELTMPLIYGCASVTFTGIRHLHWNDEFTLFWGQELERGAGGFFSDSNIMRVVCPCLPICRLSCKVHFSLLHAVNSRTPPPQTLKSTNQPLRFEAWTSSSSQVATYTHKNIKVNE